jgi:mono/diheme cytochrome c family protein
MKKILSVASVAVMSVAIAAAQDDKPAAKGAGDAAKGKELAEQCGACHAFEGDEKKMGPSLAGLYKKEKLKNGAKVTDASVLKIINEGGNGMPAYADMLSDEEKKHILAFLKTL